MWIYIIYIYVHVYQNCCSKIGLLWHFRWASDSHFLIIIIIYYILKYEWALYLLHSLRPTFLLSSIDVLSTCYPTGDLVWIPFLHIGIQWKILSEIFSRTKSLTQASRRIRSASVFITMLQNLFYRLRHTFMLKCVNILSTFMRRYTNWHKLHTCCVHNENNKHFQWLIFIETIERWKWAYWTQFINFSHELFQIDVLSLRPYTIHTILL